MCNVHDKSRGSQWVYAGPNCRSYPQLIVKCIVAMAVHTGPSMYMQDPLAYHLPENCECM